LGGDDVSADRSILKEIKIADIRVGSRHHRDMGDLTTLADSIRHEGLLQPIGVTDRLELVFGQRRIRAVPLLLGLRRSICYRSCSDPYRLCTG
jgi:ParB-like chromosome segregation protein Spo0J